MILTKEVEVAITYNNIQHYKELGYDIKCGNKIVVPIEHLSLQSNKKIKVKCDVCGKEKEMKYQDYIKAFQMVDIMLVVVNVHGIKTEKLTLSIME